LNGKIRAFEYRAASTDCDALIASTRSVYSVGATERQISNKVLTGTQWTIGNEYVVDLSYYEEEKACWYAAYFDPVTPSVEASRASQPPPDSQTARVRCSQVRPDFPASIRRNPAFTEATVVVQLELLPPRTVGSASIVSSSGYQELDASVLAAFRNITCSFPTPLTEPRLARQTFLFKLP
jgi:TonB family protein